jgi:hypothetical protein
VTSSLGPGRPLAPEMPTQVVEETPSTLVADDITSSRRLWGAMMLCLDWWTWESVAVGQPVRAGNLDGEVLRHALRGARLPDVEAYLQVTAPMLEAVAEHGPFEFSRVRAR